MSTLKVEALTNTLDTYTLPIDDIGEGITKAWVNFNGQGSIDIRSSYNVSSITDLGTGAYQVNFANPLTNSNLVPNVDVARLGGALIGSNLIGCELDNGTLNQTYFRFQAYYMGLGGSTTVTTAFDPGACFCTVSARY